jgi:hypothetical protein
MRRQVVIGGLVGIALGGLITFSIAHGLVSWPAASAIEAGPPSPAELEAPVPDGGDVGFAPHRPLRPGSDRVGRSRTKAQALAAVVPSAWAPAV